MSLYGTSLTLCVMDLQSKKVKIEDVRVIFTHHKFKTFEELNLIFGLKLESQKKEWNEWDEEYNYFLELYQKNKIVQLPRTVENQWYPNPSSHWHKSLEEFYVAQLEYGNEKYFRALTKAKFAEKEFLKEKSLQKLESLINGRKR